MKISNLKYILASATLALAVSCGGGGDLDGGASTCTNDANCGTGKVCHPVLKACVASCTGSGDCPSSAKTCGLIDGTAATATAPGFCQCSTDALCNPGGTADAAGALVCQPNVKQCAAKCTSSASCNGGTCDTATGKCGAAVVVDAGTDAGVADAGMMVDAGTPCSTANPQPDVCGYSKTCNSTMKCQDALNSSCANITAAIARTPPTFTAWAGASGTGPVIFSHVDEAVDVAADCSADNAFTVTINAYAGPNNTFPANKSDLMGFKYFTQSGAATDIAAALLKPSNYSLSANAKVMTAKFTLCSVNMNAVDVAFAFTNGNPYCLTLTR